MTTDPERARCGRQHASHEAIRSRHGASRLEQVEHLVAGAWPAKNRNCKDAGERFSSDRSRKVAPQGIPRDCLAKQVWAPPGLIIDSNSAEGNMPAQNEKCTKRCGMKPFFVQAPKKVWRSSNQQDPTGFEPSVEVNGSKTWFEEVDHQAAPAHPPPCRCDGTTWRRRGGTGRWLRGRAACAGGRSSRAGTWTDQVVQPGTTPGLREGSEAGTASLWGRTGVGALDLLLSGIPDNRPSCKARKQKRRKRALLPEHHLQEDQVMFFLR